MTTVRKKTDQLGMSSNCVIDAFSFSFFLVQNFISLITFFS